MKNDEKKILRVLSQYDACFICVRSVLDCNLSEYFQVRHCTCQKSALKNFNLDDNGIRVSITVIRLLYTNSFSKVAHNVICGFNA